MELKSIATLLLALILAAPPMLRGQDAAEPTPLPGAMASPSAGHAKNLTFAVPGQSPANASASPAESPAPASSGSPAPPVITAKNFTVVQAPKLIVLLPDPPPGWSSDKPEGATSESAGFPITTVGCVYVKGDADDAPTATVNIIDSANNQQFQDATKAMWSATSNTPEGYDKTVTVAGLPGFEHYANADQTGVLWVICGGRFFVQVETTRQPPADLETWLARIDLKKLSTLR